MKRGNILPSILLNIIVFTTATYDVYSNNAMIKDNNNAKYYNVTDDFTKVRINNTFVDADGNELSNVTFSTSTPDENGKVDLTISISDVADVPFLWFEKLEPRFYKKYAPRIEKLKQ